MTHYVGSRLHLGRNLRAYKAHFKAQRGWSAVVKVIAAAISRDERTVYRIVADQERAAKLPELVLEAMDEEGIDPAVAKHADMVEHLLRMPAPANPQEAAASVSSVAVRHSSEKSELRLSRRKKQIATEDLAVFTKRIVQTPPSVFPG